MAVGWGIDPLVENGVVTSGTGSQEVRKIWGAIYSEGVISGCGISTSSTGLTYTVEEGVMAITVGTNERVLAYIPKTTITTGTVASARTDTIYVRQNIPGSTNNVQVDVAQGVAEPANAVVLGKYSLAAGATKTSGAAKLNATPYSIPYGANLGTFYAHTDTSNSVLPKTTRTGATGVVNLQTDRRVRITIDTCLSAVRSDQSTKAYRFDDAAYCEIGFDIYLNGTRRIVFGTPGLHQAWATYHFEEDFLLTKGEYTFMYKTRYLGSGAGYADRHYSGTDLSTGTTFKISDGGVIL